jgi:hypothetical protein
MHNERWKRKSKFFCPGNGSQSDNQLKPFKSSSKALSTLEFLPISSASFRCYNSTVACFVCSYGMQSSMETPSLRATRFSDFYYPSQSVEVGVMTTMIMQACIAPRAFTTVFHLASSFRIKNSSSRTRFQPPNAGEKWILFSISFLSFLRKINGGDCCVPLNWDYKYTQHHAEKNEMRMEKNFFFNSSIFRWFPSDARSQLHQKKSFPIICFN